MKLTLSTLKIAGAVSAVAIGGWLSYRAVYASPRDELNGQLETTRAAVRSLEERLADRESIARRLKEFGSSTLGKKEDQVVDRFRNGLSRIAETSGLSDIQINSGSPKTLANPVSGLSKLQSVLRRSLKKTPDFAAINGTLEAVGSWPQVLRAVALLQSQPWIHRVEGFTIESVGKDRERFKFRVEVATAFAPDLVGTKDADPVQASIPVEVDQMMRTIASRNPFKGPAPAAAVVAVNTNPIPPPQPVPAPPPLPLYNDWRLTSVVSGRNGVEAWLVNMKTNEGQTLRTGGKLLDVEFVEGQGERAVFLIGGEKFELYNGETFASRRPVK